MPLHVLSASVSFYQINFILHVMTVTCCVIEDLILNSSANAKNASGHCSEIIMLNIRERKLRVRKC